MSCWWLLPFVWIVSMPITYALPLFWLEKSFFHNTFKSIKKSQLIVILGGALTQSSTMNPPNLSRNLLERVRFGAFLQRKSNLPILVTGCGSHPQYSEAKKMKEVLEEEFGAKVAYVEEQSNSTKENALFSFEILKKRNISTIALVSNSWHLKRANYLFEKHTFGIEIVPIADFFYANQKFETELSDFLPNMSTFYYQRRFYCEIVALLVYRLRDRYLTTKG